MEYLCHRLRRQRTHKTCLCWTQRPWVPGIRGHLRPKSFSLPPEQRVGRRIPWVRKELRVARSTGKWASLSAACYLSAHRIFEGHSEVLQDHQRLSVTVKAHSLRRPCFGQRLRSDHVSFQHYVQLRAASQTVQDTGKLIRHQTHLILSTCFHRFRSV